MTDDRLKDACISSEGGGNREHLSSAKAAAAPGSEDACEKDAKRHFLVIHEKGFDYSIVHPHDCPTEEYASGLPCDGPEVDYVCGVGVEIAQVGLSSSLPEWEEMEPGRYPIEFWSERHPAIPGYTVEEWSGGVRLV